MHSNIGLTDPHPVAHPKSSSDLSSHCSVWVLIPSPHFSVQIVGEVQSPPEQEYPFKEALHAELHPYPSL